MGILDDLRREYLSAVAEDARLGEGVNSANESAADCIRALERALAEIQAHR